MNGFMQRQVAKAIHTMTRALRVRLILYLPGHSPVVVHPDFFIERIECVKHHYRGSPIIATAQQFSTSQNAGFHRITTPYEASPGLV